MIKASIDLQDLRRRIYVKAKARPSGVSGDCPETKAGWKRWNRRWLYDTRRVQRLSSAAGRAESRSSRIGLISPGMKPNGGAQCGKSACCRSTWRGLETWHGRDSGTLADERAKTNREPKLQPKPARQSSTLLQPAVEQRRLAERRAARQGNRRNSANARSARVQARNRRRPRPASFARRRGANRAGRSHR